MRTYTDQQVLDRVRALSNFTTWTPGIWEIAVRSTADEFDSFDDKMLTYTVQPGESPKFRMSRRVTTNSGSYGLKHFSDYNKDGTAVARTNWINEHCWSFGKHHGKPAYVQTGPIDYYRDPNANERAEEIGSIRNNLIGLNNHRAGQNSTIIHNWSTACVATANLTKFLLFLETARKHGYPKATFVCLKEF